ncbi:urease accessory protein UreE [Crenothrix polyspora]|uniref:Urease accessory protein UreE n=1 Tax=Crenothrix polyspora TaxID=360316 RepID=A0A1R4HJY2_9GAMM|nr:Urease accessory protein UreE [Crenothrix polyspora]
MMLKLTEFAPQESPSDDVVTLPYDARQKSRLLSKTDSGIKIGMSLPRGQVLRQGFVLTGSDHFRVRINAAPEALSIVRTEDALQFARACYHLGNRHVALQILPGELRFLTDHVLDQMLVGLGLTVTHDVLPFEPEHGAYHGHGH